MKLVISLAAATMLAGCATPGSIERKAPAFEAPSAKSALALEECVASALSKLGSPSTVRGEGRTTMIYGQPNPAFTFTIVDRGSDRMVEGRSGVGSANSLKKKVIGCL
jgi:hypothetical protein